VPSDIQQVNNYGFQGLLPKASFEKDFIKTTALTGKAEKVL